MAGRAALVPPRTCRAPVSAGICGTQRGVAAAPEERRLITALFADVSGFTSLADRLDPEELLEVIDPVIAGLSSIVGRYGGYVEKFAGDALLALFGAPDAHEDDATRALLSPSRCTTSSSGCAPSCRTTPS